MIRIFLRLFSVLFIGCVSLPGVTVQAQESMVPLALRKSNAARVEQDRQAAPAPWNNASFVYYAVPAISPVQRLPDTYPRDGKFLGTLDVIAAQGEFEPASFVAYAFDDVKRLELRASVLRCGEAMISPEALDIKVVKVWYQQGSAWFGFYGDPTRRVPVPELLLHDESLVRVDHATQDNYIRYTQPDGSGRYAWMSFSPTAVNYTKLGQANPALIEDSPSLRPVTLAHGEFKQFFVTISVPEDAVPGLYKGHIAMMAEGQEVGRVPVSLRVLPFKLPRPATAYDLSREFYGSMYVEQLGDLSSAALKNLADHNILHPMMERGFQAQPPEDFARLIRRMEDAGLSIHPLFGAGVYVRALADEPPTPAQQDVLDELKKEIAKAMDTAEKYAGHRDIYMYGYDEGGASTIRKERAAWRIAHEAGVKTMVSSYPHGRFLFNLDYLVIPGMPWEKKSIIDKHHAANPDSLVAWYADPHTGPENPAYARRLHGLMAYQENYDAISNYVWERNSWNDFWYPREPHMRGLNMVYPAKNDVIDTLQWEGLREGLDDIRYATKLKQLAADALKSGNVDTNYTGRKALSWLAYWDAGREDLAAGRLEMIRYILLLDDALKAEKTPVASEQHAQVLGNHAAMKTAIDESTAIDPAVRELLDAPASREVLRSICVFATGLAKQDVTKSEAILKMAMKKKDLTGEQRVILLHHLLILDLKYADYAQCKSAFDELLKAVADENVELKTLRDPVAGWFADHTIVTYASKAVEADDFAAAESAYQRAIELSSKKIDAYFGAAEMAMIRGDNAAAIAVLKQIRSNESWPAVKHYVAAMTQLALTSQNKAALKKGIVSIDDEFAKENFTTQQRYMNLSEAAAVLFRASRYDDARVLEAEAVTLMRPEPGKTFICHYVKDAPTSADSWARSPLLQDPRYRESRFESYAKANLYDTRKHDLARLIGAEQAATVEKEGYDTSVYIVYNERGVYIYAHCQTPDARKVEQGLERGGQLEMYVQPGKRRAYHQWWFQLPGTDQRVTVSWDTPNKNYRFTGDHIVKSTTVRDGVIGAYTFIPWMMVYDTLPSASNPWVFSMQRFSPNVSVTLGGAVHEIGRALKLNFEISQKQSLDIKREIVIRAYAKYKADRSRADGVSIWNDPELGDPQFYNSEVKPLLERLDKAGEFLAGEMSDADVENLFEKFVPVWMELSYETADLRSAYLNNQLHTTP